MAWMAVGLFLSAVGLAGSAASGKRASRQAEELGKLRSDILLENAEETLYTAGVNTARIGTILNQTKERIAFNLSQLDEDIGRTITLGVEEATVISRNYKTLKGQQEFIASRSGFTGGSQDYVINDSEHQYELAMFRSIRNNVWAANKLRAQKSLAEFDGNRTISDLTFQRDETWRLGQEEAKNLRLEAKYALKGGVTSANNIRSQNYANMVNGAISIANQYQQYQYSQQTLNTNIGTVGQPIEIQNQYQDAASSYNTSLA